jgi:hypothetical protein
MAKMGHRQKIERKRETQVPSPAHVHFFAYLRLAFANISRMRKRQSARPAQSRRTLAARIQPADLWPKECAMQLPGRGLRPGSSLTRRENSRGTKSSRHIRDPQNLVGCHPVKASTAKYRSLARICSSRPERPTRYTSRPQKTVSSYTRRKLVLESGL